jgi:trimeric autotransporter adhesin
MVTLVNRAKMSTSTTGTGTITLGSAETGYQSFADAGVADGDVIRYVIEDGDAWEIGSGTYTATGTTLSRTVDESSNSDAALNLTGSAVVFITAAAEDVFQGELIDENPSSPTAPSATGTNAFAIGSGAIAAGNNSAALGNSRAGAANSIAGAINNNSSSYGTTGVNTVSFGTQSRATNNSAASIGQSSIASGYQSAAYGYNAVASGQDSFAGGPTTDATATNSTALGKNAQATHANATAVGYNAATSATNQVALGASGYAVKISDTYTLPTSDGTNGQVLTTDGSGAVTFADAGGGGADLYAAETTGSTDPTASGTLSVAIGSSAVADGTNAVAIGTGSDAAAFSVSIGSNTDAGGAPNTVAIGRIGTSTYASSSVIIGHSASTAAYTNYQTALGYNAKTNAEGAVALQESYAGGADSFAAGITSNSTSYGATGAKSLAIGYQTKATSTGAVGIGYQTQATGQYNTALGGYQTQATGTYHSLGLGSNARSSAFASTAINGGNVGSYATADWSVSMGGGALSSIIGKFAYSSAGAFGVGATGDAQQGTYVLRSDTTDATAEAMTTNNSTAAANNQIVLANESAYSFTGTVVCREDATDGDDYAGWEVKGVIMRQGAAADTTLGVGIVNKLYSTSGISAADVALSADTTNGGLKVEVTGVASTNLRWVATINTSEVINA